MMKVDEEQRRELFDRLRVHLDEETATLLLEVTMPANIGLATRGDTQELRAEMLLRFAQLDGPVTEVEGNIGRQISDLQPRVTEMDSRLSQQIVGLDARINGLDAKMTGKLYKVVVPVLATWNLLIVGIATWIGIVVS